VLVLIPCPAKPRAQEGRAKIMIWDETTSRPMSMKWPGEGLFISSVENGRIGEQFDHPRLQR
jgi:hypothetical protein